MMLPIVARSISRTVRERLHRLQNNQFEALVLAVFKHTCDLVTHDGNVIALVLPQIGDGPLNIVVDGTAGLFAGVEPGVPATVERTQLWISELGIDLGSAMVWEPRPDWETLRGRRTAIASQVPLLRTLCLRYAPAGSLLALLGGQLPDDVPAKAILCTAREAAEALREGWAGDIAQLREGAVRLAGLGSGLTPAGDDFLAGVMLWSWLAHPTPSSLCQTLVEITAPRTTILSAAFLRAAAQGECSALWHTLLAALREGKSAKITGAVQEILAHGATSGADSLAGFLHPSS
jgi:hypothetical protein